MMASCKSCGEPFDPLESGIGQTCPNCSDTEEQTISELGHPPTRTGQPGELSVTGIHGSLAIPAQPVAKSNWKGKVFGDYQIVGTLGKGGMGMVFLAVQQSTARKVALKVIRDDRLNDFDSTLAQEWVARFKSEALAAARLEHENIVTVYEVGQLEGNHFFSMQYVAGKSLSRISKERVLTGRQVAKYMIPICRALHHAHSRGILHRDIKPGNIMIDEQDRPFLTDFGLAKWFEDDDHSMTRSGQVVGTATYMSPQQATDASHATIACDVYSLGATIYRLLAGRPPFDQGSLVEVLRQVVHDEPAAPSSHNHAIDSDIETIALKCLEKNPELRYPTADELADDLQRYLNGEPITARPVSKQERFWRWCKRNPIIAGLAASAILLLLTTVVVSTVGYMRVRDSLRTTLLNQAIGMQSSTEGGRRNKALNALTSAARIRPGLDLRNEYARYLDQPDIEELHEKPIDIPGWDSGWAPYAEAISGTNRIIAVADGHAPVEIDAVKGEIVKTYENLGYFGIDNFNDSELLAQVSRNGSYLAGNPKNGKAIGVWDLNQAKKLGELRDSDGTPIEVECLVFNEDESNIFCAGHVGENERDVYFYRFSMPELELTATWHEKDFSVSCLKLIKNDYLLAGLATSEENVVLVWKDIFEPKPQKLFPPQIVSQESAFTNSQKRIAFHPRFEHIYIGESSGYPLAFKFSPKQDSITAVPHALLGRHAKEITALDVSKDGRWLVSCGEDRQLKIWDTFSGYVVTQIEIETDRAPNVQWLSDGKTLLTDTANGIRLWKFLPPISRRFIIRNSLGDSGFYAQAIKFDASESSLLYLGNGLISRLDLTIAEAELEAIREDENSSQLFLLARRHQVCRCRKVWRCASDPFHDARNSKPNDRKYRRLSDS